MYKITIIVPIYNVERYLRECLDSIVNQTDKNFHVILVNDGTKDSSGEIALEYVKKYPKLFEYIKQENKGLGGARNTGLRAVKTKYVRFFDSDDFMAPRTMETLNKELEKDEVDILFFYPAIYDMVTLTYQYWYDYLFINGIIKPNKVFNPHDYPFLMEAEANVCRMVWRTDFLRDLNFEFIEHTYWEDVPPHFFLFHNAKTAKISEVQGAYIYRTNSPTQVTSSGGKNRLDMKNIFAAILPYFRDKSWSRKEKAHMIGFLSNYMFWSINVTSDEYLPQFIDISHDFFKHISLSQYFDFVTKTKICVRNKVLIWYLKSNLHYNTLKDRKKIKSRMKLFKKIKGVFKGKNGI